MRRIAVVSVGRSDRGHLQPVIEALGEEAVPIFCSGDLEWGGEPVEVAAKIAREVHWFGTEWKRRRPDLILLFGDRYEQLAAAMASLPFAIPLAHLHGGETTAGAFDNQIRHAITKMAHLHLVSHRRHGARVYRMGEERWRIHDTGAPGLDRIPRLSEHTREELAERFALDPYTPWVLVTLHPCTLEYEQTEAVAVALRDALATIDYLPVITAPNADTCASVITRTLGATCPAPTDAEYLSLMAEAGLMVGNSSSGIIEAPSFRLPVVNIGRRQHGRLRSDNVIDVGTTSEEIAAGITRALDPAFRDTLSGVNPYGDGQAAPRIAHLLRTVPLDRRLLEKR